jgi:hypothetical protein
MTRLANAFLDTNKELKTTLIEEYLNKEKLSNGKIYCKIRQYKQEGNICFMKRWKAFLSNYKQWGLW